MKNDLMNIGPNDFMGPREIWERNQALDLTKPEFCREVQPPASLKGLDIPSRRAVFVPWKPSRRPAFGMGNPTFR